VTEQDIEDIAEKAAAKAVEKVFMSLGLDLSTAEGVRDAQDDFRYTRFMRKLQAKVGSNSISLAVKLMVGCAIIYIASRLGFKIPSEVLP
jgi:hypothetical protein